MKSRTIALTLGMMLVGLTLCFAEDANMGTWRLNEAKSKLVAGAPKNTTVVYETAGDKVKVTVDGVATDGKPVHDEWVGKFDSNDYPVTGDPSSDARSYARIDDHTLVFDVRKGGKAVAGGRIVISADGKSRTVTLSGTSASGKPFKSVAVYDKQ